MDVGNGSGTRRSPLDDQRVADVSSLSILNGNKEKIRVALYLIMLNSFVFSLPVYKILPTILYTPNFSTALLLFSLTCPSIAQVSFSC